MGLFFFFTSTISHSHLRLYNGNSSIPCELNSIHTISKYTITHVRVYSNHTAVRLCKYISDFWPLQYHFCPCLKQRRKDALFLPSGNNYSLSMSLLPTSLPMILGLLYINVGLRRKAADGCIPRPSAASANTIIEMVIFWYRMMTCVQPEIPGPYWIMNRERIVPSKLIGTHWNHSQFSRGGEKSVGAVYSICADYVECQREFNPASSSSPLLSIFHSASVKRLGSDMLIDCGNYFLRFSVHAFQQPLTILPLWGQGVGVHV